MSPMPGSMFDVSELFDDFSILMTEGATKIDCRCLRDENTPKEH